jgi:hypothetical protein
VLLLLSRLSAAAERTSRRTPRSDGSAELITGTWRQGLACGWRVIDAWSRRRISLRWSGQSAVPVCGGSSRH